MPCAFSFDKSIHYNIFWSKNTVDVTFPQRFLLIEGASLKFHQLLQTLGQMWCDGFHTCDFQGSCKLSHASFLRECHSQSQQLPTRPPWINQDNLHKLLHQLWMPVLPTWPLYLIILYHRHAVNTPGLTCSSAQRIQVMILQQATSTLFESAY